jgi:hypothetical protein
MDAEAGAEKEGEAEEKDDAAAHEDDGHSH